MRISVKKDDIGYSKDAQKYQVFLGGHLLENCHTADEEKGVCYIDLVNGNKIVGHDVIFGDVKIKKNEL